MNISEFELIRRIVKQIPRKLRETASLQDDTAVLKPGLAYRHLLTTDAIVDKVDFHLHEDKAEHIGQKALGVNLSDVAAMGGVPECFTIALGIPPSIDAAWIKRFYTGLLVWARRFNVVCAGGDISKSDIFFASVTVLEKPVGPRYCAAEPSLEIGSVLRVPWEARCKAAIIFYLNQGLRKAGFWPIILFMR